MNLRLADERITTRIRSEVSSGALRCLDAVHLAAAREAHQLTGEGIGGARLDARFRDAAASFGLALLSATLGGEERNRSGSRNTRRESSTRDLRGRPSLVVYLVEKQDRRASETEIHRLSAAAPRGIRDRLEDRYPSLSVEWVYSAAHRATRRTCRAPHGPCRDTRKPS